MYCCNVHVLEERFRAALLESTNMRELNIWRIRRRKEKPPPSTTFILGGLYITEIKEPPYKNPLSDNEL